MKRITNVKVIVTEQDDDGTKNEVDLSAPDLIMANNKIAAYEREFYRQRERDEDSIDEDFAERQKTDCIKS